MIPVGVYARIMLKFGSKTPSYNLWKALYYAGEVPIYVTRDVAEETALKNGTLILGCTANSQEADIAKVCEVLPAILAKHFASK